MEDCLRRMEIRAEAVGDTFFVEGGRPRPAILDPRGDHRIAMAIAVLGAEVGGVVIEDAECVSKSWPRFWGAMGELGIPVEMEA
jgi:3-phosphoshikimate 1-carboxyvinyltransferase